jgi:hypothetical protein
VPHDGHNVINVNIEEFTGLFLISTPVIFGIISPPFSIVTVSFILISNLFISLELCKEAFFTIVPLN